MNFVRCGARLAPSTFPLGLRAWAFMAATLAVMALVAACSRSAPGASPQSLPIQKVAGELLPATALRVLVLYDAPEQRVDRNRVGKGYAIMLANLLGHWRTQVELLPVKSYTAGTLSRFDKIFYLGSHYDHPVPPAFLADVHATDKTVVWFRYNLWQYAWNPAHGFPAKYGFAFTQVRGLDAPPSPSRPQPGFFNRVTYKGQTFEKFYAFNPASLQADVDPDVGATQIRDVAKAKTVVSITNAVTGAQLPYVVRSKNFWYVADIPLSFIGPRDRYLVFCDLLHDMLGVDAPTSKRAMVRLEDLGARVDVQTTAQLADYLGAKGIRFGVAVIPRFRDPLGLLNGGKPDEIAFEDADQLKAALDELIRRGARVVNHGWTHQYDQVKNPWSGVSGEDYEFWDTRRNAPVKEDSVAWALGRVDRAIAELGDGPYKPFAYEVPHYQASPLAYQAIRQRFPVSWGRMVYYTSDHPNLDPQDPDRDFAMGQFFPYVIEKDYYGNKVLPENLGNINLNLSSLHPSSNHAYTAEDLLRNAEHAAVVRDGYAVFFFHPFLLHSSLGDIGMQEFRKVIEGLTALGYEWVDPAGL